MAFSSIIYPGYDLKSIIQFTMRISAFPTLVLLFLIHAVQSLQCNATIFHFTGNYTLGKQDELNRTFTKIQEKLPALPTVTYKYSSTTTYTISNAKAAFYYRDSKQKASILGNNTIVIEGGQLEVDFTYNWSKKSVITRDGTASAAGLTGPIIFAKFAVIDTDGFLSYELLDTQNLTWGVNPFQLTRIDPADVTDEDKQALTDMMNNLTDVVSLRQFLEIQIDKIFEYILRNSLHDEHEPIQKHFDYVWSPQGKPNVTIPFMRRALRVDIQQSGIALTFDVQAENSTWWKCGEREVPLLALNTRVYGHSQQFLSYDFYENVLRHGIHKGLLDTDLNRQAWQSRMFQFFAGDLYQVLASVQNKFYASAEVKGSCQGDDAGLKVLKGGDDTFNASVYFHCQLNILTETVLKFGVGLQAEIEGIPRATSLDFRLRRHNQFISLYELGDYKVINEPLARAMISSCINRLYGSHLFGSGWPLYPARDYPHFMSDINFSVIYDSSFQTADQEMQAEE